MRVIVAGSRDWEGIYGESRIVAVLNQVLALADALGRELTIVHGGCPTGADAITDRWCRRREDQVKLEAYPANWQWRRKGAGPVRNKDMVERGADMCLAFIKDYSRGATGLAVLAQEAGIPTYVVPWEEPE